MARVVHLGLLALAAAAAFAVSGCQRSLLHSELPRTQYDRYELLRNRYTPLEEPDEFGHPRPALRERLSHARWQ